MAQYAYKHELPVHYIFSLGRVGWVVVCEYKSTTFHQKGQF